MSDTMTSDTTTADTSTAGTTTEEASTTTSGSTGSRIAVVTGASAGLGRATAVAFAEAGWPRTETRIDYVPR